MKKYYAIAKAMACAAMMICSAASLKAEDLEAAISINDRIQYQHVTGFGGFSPSPQWSYWLTNKEMETLFGKGEDQLGLTILRLYMANNRNYWSAGLANAKVAKKYGAFVFASPWSPPASWKTNNSDSNGGELLPERYSDWARFLNDYYNFMVENGVDLDAVSIQNEPDWNTTYQSCIWSGEQMATFLRKYGRLIHCKIIAPEAVHFSRNMHEPILNDPDACEHLDILGGHFYGWDGSSYPLAAQKGKEVWMTEYLINERQQNQGIDINWKDDGFLFARSINDAMLANMSAWVHYSLKRYYGCLGDGSYGTVNNKVTKRGYILSHYAKYVSGTTRIRHGIDDASNVLTASSYLTVTGDSIVLMVLNQSNNSYRTTVTLPFNTTYCKEIVTTEDKDMAKRDISFDSESYYPEVAIEPYSVTTYIFVKSSDRSDREDEGSEDDAIFTDRFEEYGASCVPEGWRVSFDGTVRYAGEYTLGPRIMSFSPEGMISHAFYFRTSVGVGSIYYGQDSSHRLKLQPGTYKLKYSIIGWKGTPEVTTMVQKVGSREPLVQTTDTPETQVEGNGPSVRIGRTTDGELDFEITTQANYLIKWQVPSPGSGMNEVLVANIRLIKTDGNGVETVILDTLDQGDGTIYDLLGRPVSNPTAPGIYIKNGKKYIVK